MAPTGGNGDDACANCGGPADGLEQVRRVYMSVDSEGRLTASETMEISESWCLSCRALYPHFPVAPGGPGAGDPPEADEES